MKFIQPIQAYLEQVVAHIRLADLLDIAVIACLLYFCFVWFRNRASRALAVGIVLIATLYLAARWLDMGLTMWLFQAGVTAIVLTLIVIFQHDNRRAFERLATSNPFQRQASLGAAPGIMDTLVLGIVTLAEHRTGALIVFEGREPIERHVQGGVPVDGKISLPLLQSIFQPDSPGHDGAIVIKSERIDALGVHLPLSGNLKLLGDRGTRHAAALGLAERCDAQVVVVSEERGTISLAERGDLREIQPRELIRCLERAPATEGVPKRFGMIRHLGLKLAALLSAVVLWLLFAYQIDTIQRTLRVPIEYRNLPEGMVVANPQWRFVEVTLSGSERAAARLDADALVVSFDLNEAQPDTPVILRVSESLNLPAELTPHQIRPEHVEIRLRRAPQPEPAPLPEAP